MNDKRDIGRLSKTISIKIKRILDSRLNDITDIQLFILAFIYNNQDKKEVYQKDIENVLEVRRSTTTEILNIMEKNDLIRRIDSFDDKRKKVIILTDKGNDYVIKFQEIIVDVENNLLKDIAKEELEIFFKVTEKIKDNIKKMEDDVC